MFPANKVPGKNKESWIKPENHYEEAEEKRN